MQSLFPLVQLHQKNPSPTFKSWLKKNYGTKMGQLYFGIANGELDNDVKASLCLYQDTSNPNYRRLKCLLKEKLQELAQFIPLSGDDLHNESLKDARNSFVRLLINQKQ